MLISKHKEFGDFGEITLHNGVYTFRVAHVHKITSSSLKIVTESVIESIQSFIQRVEIMKNSDQEAYLAESNRCLANARKFWRRRFPLSQVVN